MSKLCDLFIRCYSDDSLIYGQSLKNKTFHKTWLSLNFTQRCKLLAKHLTIDYLKVINFKKFKNIIGNLDLQKLSNDELYDCTMLYNQLFYTFYYNKIIFTFYKNNIPFCEFETKQ